MTKTCAVCQTSPAKVFCSADDAYLCSACDANLHSVAISHHERHFICAICDGHAKIWCRNDQAYLCTACDKEIHTSNPLAARHERVPVQAIEDGVQLTAASSAFAGVDVEAADPVVTVDIPETEEGSNELAGCNIKIEDPAPIKACKDLDVFELDGCLFDIGFDFAAFDEMLNQGSTSDGVVPVMPEAAESATSSSSGKHELSLEESLSSGFAFSPYSPSPDVSTIGMPFIPSQHPVPAASQQPQTAGPHQQLHEAGNLQQLVAPVKVGSHSFDVPEALQVAGGQERPLDRKERVLRYREKRKRRTFEKTIRYHSRKAYAEIRPRIKGRFATKEEVEAMKLAAAAAAVNTAAPLQAAADLLMPAVFARC